MEDPSVFSYIGEEILDQRLGAFAKTIQGCFATGSAEYNALTAQVTKLHSNQEKWPQKIFQKWQNRDQPAFKSEDISKINQSNTSRLDGVNESRKRNRDSLKSDIARYKKKLDDILVQRDKQDDQYNTAEIVSRTQSLLLPNDQARIHADLTTAHGSYMYAITRLMRQETTVRQAISDLEEDFIEIQLLSTQGIQKYLIVTKHLKQLGWLPSEDDYVMIQNPKPPPCEEIFRRVSYEPQTKMTNLPLSIYNLIVMADEIGATDSALLSMITTYLKEHRPDILDVLDTKKQSLTAIMEILSFQCSTDLEKNTVLQKLKTFRREITESFAAAATRFESLYCFYLQLEKPSTTETIKLMSYQVLRQISQYLLSHKCSLAFGKWAAQQTNTGIEVTKESIIRVITQLENNPDLRLTHARNLPGSLITTTLNLPIGEPETETIMANYMNPTLPVNVPHKVPTRPSTPKPPSRTASGNPIRTASGNRPKTPPGNRPKTPPGIRPKTPPTHRKSSPSPNRAKPEERGRQVNRTPSINARTYSVDLDPQLEAVQFYSHWATSPNPVRKVPMPTIFRRPFTPNTAAHMKNTYFMPTSGAERFKDVRSLGNCLRCFGANHRANVCQTYTKPAPSPCKFCFHLFHDSSVCKYYNTDGTQRTDRSPSVKR